MNRATSFIISIIVLLLVFGGGIVFGMFWQVQKDAPQIEIAAKTLKTLTSNAVPSITVYGQISNISGRTITVSFNEDAVVVKMHENAAVSFFEISGQGGTRQDFDFNALKEGQTISLSAKLLPDGSLQGESLIVLASK